jgi:hypothetical protein
LKDVDELLGKEVSSVAFVGDGVEFRFGSTVLLSPAAPYVTIGESTYRFPTAGSRDALCLVIGSVVESLDHVDGQCFEFTTSNGCRVRIPLDGRSLQLA